MLPSTTENLEEFFELVFFVNTKKIKLKLESEESHSTSKWDNHVILKARYHHRKYQIDIFCGIKKFKEYM